MTKNIEKINPESLEDYLRFQGYHSLKKALKGSPQKIIEIVKESGLRGRSGGSFPTGLKLEAVAQNVKKRKTSSYLICNAHEGEPYTFKDRYLLEKNPHLVLEGMIIAGFCVGARRGIIYLNPHYGLAKRRLEEAIRRAKQNKFLGRHILDKNFNFTVEIFLGFPAYLCGEETTLIEDLEGKRTEPRLKPPLVAEVGLFSKPTLVLNVETLANLPLILKRGAKEFKKIGSEKSPGTKLINLAGEVRKPGLYEIEMGTALREVIYKLGGGIKKGKKIKFVQIGGGACGQIIPPKFLDLPLEFGFPSIGVGTIIVYDEEKSILDFLGSISWFFRRESCGKCAPCREGTYQLTHLVEKLKEEKKPQYLDLILKIAEFIAKSSFCGFGGVVSWPIESAIRGLRKEIEAEIREKK